MSMKNRPERKSNDINLKDCISANIPADFSAGAIILIAPKYAGSIEGRLDQQR